MKFFHVYNEWAYEGLVKNGLLDEDSGFKIQHAFSVPDDLKFNRLAAKGGKLYDILREGRIPFYVDRIAGGITYYPYAFDRDLIREYEDLLGDWFLGFQLHESGSNRRRSDWPRILRVMEGSKGPYDPEMLKSRTVRESAVTPDGEVLYAFSQDAPETYAKMRYAESTDAYFAEMLDLFRRRMAETGGHILPCDSYYLVPRLEAAAGMRSFMPEVGCQIPLMREAVAMARGAAKTTGGTWGTYYECWRESDEAGTHFYSMPCFNSDPSNEWYLTQKTHTDDFTTYGENGGSSRLLQSRIYYYALMAGADYFSEEWGLNCSYSDMHDFTHSEYGKIKKDFIRTARTLRGVRAQVPFAVVLPKEYACAEIPDGIYHLHDFDGHRDLYMETPVGGAEKAFVGHVEDVIRLLFYRNGAVIGNEGHVITNSRFGDVFDLIYEDAPDAVLRQYEYLIDGSPDGGFAKEKERLAKAGKADARKADAGKAEGADLRILLSTDLEGLAATLDVMIRKTMPCTVDGLCWLVSSDGKGRRFLTILNNEGNERSLRTGDTVRHEADRRVRAEFREPAELRKIREGKDPAGIDKADARTYYISVPAAGFVILEF